MTAAADYRALETLRDGQKVEIRALRPSDREGWLAAFRRASAETLHHRLFAVMRVPTEAEVDYFLNIDFVKHVALVAMTHENGVPTIIGVCRYVVVQPRSGRNRLRRGRRLSAQGSWHGLDAALGADRA